MARSTRPVSRTDGALRYLETRARRRSVGRESRRWFWVFVALWATRRVRRAIGSEPAVVYRGEIKPGDTIQIAHLTETYGGKRVRRR
jgi:hypothetical protein